MRGETRPHCGDDEQEEGDDDSDESADGWGRIWREEDGEIRNWRKGSLKMGKRTF